MLRTVCLVLAAASAWSHDISCDTTPVRRAAAWKEVAQHLAADYDIEEGYMQFKATELYGGNPTTLYGRYYVDSGPSGANEGLMLGEGDAVVFYGCTPPAGRYFSWRSYVFFSPKPEPAMLFASLGDSANNLIFNTTNTQGAPFNSTAVVVTTADRTTYNQVSTAFAASGHPSTATNLDGIPSSLVSMGYDHRTNDWFTMLVRFALPDSKPDGDHYLNATFPIFRLKRKTPFQKDPLPVAPLRNRTMPVSEGRYTSSVASVQKAVEGKLGGMGYKLKSTASAAPFDIDGYVCIKERSNCIGDNHDAAYLKENSTGSTLGETELLVVVGVNHHAAGTGVYSNIAMYKQDPSEPHLPAETVPISVTDKEFKGSAEFYSSNGAGVGELYAFTFSRACPAELGQYCRDVSLDDVPSAETIVVANRDYLNTQTKTGPSYSQLFMPRVMLFSKN